MEQVKFKVSVGEDNIVYLTLAGDIKEPQMDELKGWIKEVEDVIRTQREKIGHGVLCLVDISNFGAYSGDVLTEIASMMKVNEQFVRRTATFGGKEYLVLAQDAVAALSGRKNFQAFKHKEEALAWLLETAE